MRIVSLDGPMRIASSSRHSTVFPQALVKRLPAQLVLGRGAAIGIGAAGIVLVIWAAVATWYIGAHDDLAERIFVREVQMQYGYEERIRALQAQLERSATQNLLERNGLMARVDALASRQSEFETRQSWLKAIAERVPGLSDRSVARAGALFDKTASEPATTSSLGGYAATSKPTPLPDGFLMRLREAEPDNQAPKPHPRDRLSGLESALDTLGAGQIKVAEALRHTAQDRLAQLRVAIGATGLDVERLASSAAPIGGPLVPVSLAPNAGTFGPLAAELDATFAELDGLLGASRSLPFKQPIMGELEPTSSFGYRLDPFTRGPALHTGIDLRAENGTPVRATAAGRVSVAEYSGGYGNMVEIDHGGGIATRYGHLSGFAVAPGERIEAGQIVGRTGSTGRSTGSHLHYETRINGEPSDPIRFLRAGQRLTWLLGANQSMSSTASPVP